MPRCDEAAWRFLGLSLAGYDVLISFALDAIAAFGAVAAWRAAQQKPCRCIVLIASSGIVIKGPSSSGQRAW
jgi:hypothetical protein